MRERERERHGETNREIPSSGSRPDCLQWLRLSQELNPGFPPGLQGFDYLSHHLLPPMVHIIGNQDQEQSWDSNPRPSDTMCRLSNWCLNPYTTVGHFAAIKDISLCNEASLHCCL